MGFGSHAEVVEVVRRDAAYQRSFREIFGHDPGIDDIAAAIATFERTVISGNAPFDRFIAGDAPALSESARRGWALWNSKARCNTCHAGSASAPFFTDNKFHNIGVAGKNRDFAALARQAASSTDSKGPWPISAHKEGFSELGRFLVTKQPKDIGAFKTHGAPGCRPHRSLHARRKRADAQGRGRLLRQGR